MLNEGQAVGKGVQTTQVDATSESEKARDGHIPIMSSSDGGWSILTFIALAQIGAMSTWFSAAAVAPSLARDWQLTNAQLALLTVAVQLGFVLGALASAISGITDVFSTRRVYIGAALAAALANAALIVTGGNLVLAVLLRFLLGFCLAGVYPTGMKMMTGWFRKRRGLAIGSLVGALTLGSALPHVIVGLGVAGSLPWQIVILTTSGCAILSAVMVALTVKKGPFEAPSARFNLSWALGSLRDRPNLLANLGYFGHMWELYAMWTWVPVFLLASFKSAHSFSSPLLEARSASLAAAFVIGAGAVGCVLAGVLADRVGRTATTSVAMVISGSCAILTGLLFGHTPWLVILLATVWGVSIVADSAQFSASISELVPPERVGSALALQTSVGFLITAVSIQLLPFFQSHTGWSGAFAILAVGPVLGIIAMLRLRSRPEAIKLASGNR